METRYSGADGGRIFALTFVVGALVEEVLKGLPEEDRERFRRRVGELALSMVSTDASVKLDEVALQQALHTIRLLVEGAGKTR